MNENLSVPSELDLCPVAKKRCRDEATTAAAHPTTLVTIPQRVYRRPAEGAPRPPAAVMSSVGRRAAEVRLRLYLWMWAIRTTKADGVEFNRHTTGLWAELLNLLPTPDHHQRREQAARRVSNALRWLEEQALVERRGHDGFRLLDPDGSGKLYRDPSREELQAMRAARERWPFRGTGPYDMELDPLELPLSFWTSGRVSGLSARSLQVLMMLLDHQRDSGDDIYVAKVRRSHFGVTADTWTRGVAELEALRFIRRIPNHASPLFGTGDRPEGEGIYRNLFDIDRSRLFGLDSKLLPPLRRQPKLTIRI